MNSNISFYLGGVSTGLTFVIALFFIRAWTKTHERLFLFFAFAFAAFGLEKVILTIMQSTHEYRPFVFIFRIVAFGAIILGIIEKNRIRS